MLDSTFVRSMNIECFFGCDNQSCLCCFACVDCVNCIDCINCVDCVGCRDCYGSNGLNNKTYVFYGEQLTASEYFLRLKEHMSKWTLSS